MKRLNLEQVLARQSTNFDDATLAKVTEMFAELRLKGDCAVRHMAHSFGESARVFVRHDMAKAAQNISRAQRELLAEAVERVLNFGKLQEQAVQDFRLEVCGYLASQKHRPVDVAGCYAPGGRYPLPSSVIMTVATARAAGVETILVASPNSSDIMLAAAYFSGANKFVALGGVPAIATFAFGRLGLPQCDVIVGPGNKWVTAAKYLASRYTRIDMLAGPSEVLVVADDAASSAWVAADLLAQAEHDPEALPLLIAFSDEFAAKVEAELVLALQGFSNSEVALSSLRRGGYLVAENIAHAAQMANKIAPEHLELMIAPEHKNLFRNYGALFVGGLAAEVIGDYGLGPNHVLPTGGHGRFRGGLSVADFLVARTEIEAVGVDGRFMQNVADFAELEGLQGHAMAARARLNSLLLSKA